MSDLSASELLDIKTTIERKNAKKAKRGYIWGMSNKDFENFVKDSTGKNIYTDEYAVNGESKMKRLLYFLKKEDNNTVVLLLNELVKYGTKHGGKRKYISKSKAEAYQKIIKRLEAPNKTIEIKPQMFGDKKKINKLVKDIDNLLKNKEYELAVDRIHTMFASCVLYLCDKAKINTKNKSIDENYGQLNKYLNQNNIIKSGVTRNILSYVNKLTKDFDYARNNESFAHSNKIINKDEAELVCNVFIDIINFFKNIKIN